MNGERRSLLVFSFQFSARKLHAQIAFDIRSGKFFLLLMALLAGEFAQAQQQRVVNINGRAFVLNRGFVNSSPVPTTDLAIAPTGDLLRFDDGSELHGALKSIEPGPVVIWSHPEASLPIEFRGDRLDHIRLANAKSVPVTSKCHIRLVNGDEIPADITSMDWDRISANTWFSGAAVIPRTAIQSITFLPKAYSSEYEGPIDMQGWSITPPDGWRYRDGVFISRGYGALGRDLQLSGSCAVEFDLCGANRCHLTMGLYLEKDQIKYGNDSYVIELTSGTVRVRRNNPTGGSVDLGSATLPAPTQKNRVRMAIQCNQVEKTLAILADNQLVRRWKDETGFVGKGTRISFNELSGLPGVCLSDFRVSRWEGREPDIISTSQTNSDAIWLVNHDRAFGKISGLGGGKVTFMLSGHQIEIPLERITKIEFAAPTPTASQAHEVRATLSGGARISLELSHWGANEISARSAFLGPIVLKPWMIRELDFHPSQIETDSAAPVGDEFGGMDD